MMKLESTLWVWMDSRINHQKYLDEIKYLIQRNMRIWNLLNNFSKPKRETCWEGFSYSLYKLIWAIKCWKYDVLWFSFTYDFLYNWGCVHRAQEIDLPKGNSYSSYKGQDAQMTKRKQIINGMFNHYCYMPCL